MPLTTDNPVAAPALFSPAAERNKQDILAQLQRTLPARGAALEIASGTGQHVAWFAAALPGWIWQPSDVGSEAFSSITANTRAAGLTNVEPPLPVDVLTPAWRQAGSPPLGDTLFDGIYCANMLHISPWATCATLMQGAALRLASGGQLITYGPYLEDNVPTSAGNLAFDASLRGSNPAWGVRRRGDVEDAAQAAGLRLWARIEMPANNLMLLFKRTTDSSAPRN